MRLATKEDGGGEGEEKDKDGRSQSSVDGGIERDLQCPRVFTV